MPSEDLFRVAIIGCGKAAGATAIAKPAGGAMTHIEALKEHPVFLPVVAYDNDEDSCAAYCENWHLAPAHSWEEVLSHRPDALLIASPTPTHEMYLLRALDAGIRLVACEKPLVETAATARSIIEKYRSAQKSLMVFYPRRWIREVADVEASCAAGHFGGMLAIHGWYGGGIRNLGAHMIDLVLRFGGPIRSVSALSGDDADAVGRSDPTADFRLTLLSGTSAILQAYDYSRYALFELDLLYERGRFRISDLGFSIETWEANDSPHYPGFTELVSRNRLETDYAQAVVAFWVRAAETLKSDGPVIDGKDIEILSVVDAAIMALQTKGTCDVTACH